MEFSPRTVHRSGSTTAFFSASSRDVGIGSASAYKGFLCRKCGYNFAGKHSFVRWWRQRPWIASASSLGPFAQRSSCSVVGASHSEQRSSRATVLFSMFMYRSFCASNRRTNGSSPEMRNTFPGFFIFRRFSNPGRINTAFSCDLP